MDDKNSPSLILLTYKGKALLMYQNNSAIDEVAHLWCFIGSANVSKESPLNSLQKIVRHETSIKLENIDKLSETFYHCRLTDDNVNRIERREGQLLDFFTLKEIEKLQLENSTRLFITKHSDLIENTPS